MIKGVTVTEQVNLCKITEQVNSLTVTEQKNSLSIETIDIYTYYDFLSPFMVDEVHEEVQS